MTSVLAPVLTHPAVTSLSVFSQDEVEGEMFPCPWVPAFRGLGRCLLTGLTDAFVSAYTRPYCINVYTVIKKTLRAPSFLLPCVTCHSHMLLV